MKKIFVKPQAQLTSMESQQMICGSGLTGSNGSNQIIGNGGSTSTIGGGFTTVDAKGGSVSFDM